MSVSDRLREKAAGWNVRAQDGDFHDACYAEKVELLDLLADCYEVMLDKPRVSDEFISSTLARIEEVSW